MATINIGGQDHDDSYRYKMPTLQSKTEGSGNGIRTIIPNMYEIAKALHTRPDWATKFFGTELGAQTRWVEKDRLAQVNGVHTTQVLQDLLQKYIKKYILCPSCKLPEVTMNVDDDRKKPTIYFDCAACGYHDALEEQEDRLSVLISRNLADTKRQKKKDRDEGEASGETEEVGMGDIDLPIADVPVVADSEVTWYTDTSEEAAKRRQEEAMMSEGVKSLAVTTTETPSSTDPEAELKRVVSDLRQFLTKESDVAKCVREFRRVQHANSYSEEDLAYVIFTTIFETEGCDIFKEIPKQQALFAKLALDLKGQKTLLGCVERVCMNDDNVMKKVPIVLTLMYDTDMVEEEVFFKWHEKASKKFVKKSIAKKVRENAQPFMDWLKNAEEESDEE